MFGPRNFSEAISMLYMDPHPPDTSMTWSVVGANWAISLSQMDDSASSRLSGFSSAFSAEGEAGVAGALASGEVEYSRACISED
ncbi:hypothetical protein PGQ11_002767 [Apiospora arundinis]|uniref:Uncharacterized protein n=1 Tax=Apiospora arundinis TaxID=335852 RepID=A0ABR2J2Y2_9PEZI